MRQNGARGALERESMIRLHAPASEGQRQLRELGASQREIGAAVGVAHQTAGRWLNGNKAPGPDHRAKLAEVFGVPAEAWNRAPTPTEPRTLAGDLAASLKARAEAIAGAQAASVELPSTAAGLEALIAQCREARAVEGIAPTVLARIGALEVSATTAREKLRGALEVALASEDFKAFLDDLLERLEMHPLAKIALCRGSLEGHASPAHIEAWDASHAEWRQRWAPLVKAAEKANIALLECLPPHGRFDGVPAPRAA
jgi:transcriptional regulator with XRE-family HTH domain